MMKKNRLLSIAVTLCKIIQGFYVLAFVLLTAFFVHYQISPESYKDFEFKNNATTNYKITKSKSWKVIDKPDKEVFSLNKVSKLSIYFNYLQFCAVLIFTFLSIKEFQNIIESVKKLKTFQQNNIVSFRKIGKYVFIIFIISGFFYVKFESGGKSSISISLIPLILMLIAFIMAEIFKEGNQLKQENDLTI